MEASFLTFDKLKELYPNEWVLLDNPEMKNAMVLGGVVVYHNKDKKDVYHFGRDKVANFSRATIVFAGNLNLNRKIGILKRL